MSAKAQNGQAPSVASRVAVLEQRISSLVGIVDQMSGLLAKLLENQAIAAAMPSVEQQLRGQIQQAYAQGGLGALLQDAPVPQQPDGAGGLMGQAMPPQYPQGAPQPG